MTIVSIMLMIVSFCSVILTVQKWCLDNGMKLNITKTAVISCAHKSSSINYNYKLRNKIVACSQCLKDLVILLDYKLHFQSC
jgi:hypothetical protein